MIPVRGILYADGNPVCGDQYFVIGQPNNGPNRRERRHRESFEPGIYEVPRHPNDIYYNALTE